MFDGLNINVTSRLDARVPQAYPACLSGFHSAACPFPESGASLEGDEPIAAPGAAQGAQTYEIVAGRIFVLARRPPTL
jgi:hypothetical protein